MYAQYAKDDCHKIDIRRNNVILCFLKDNEDSSIIENHIKDMNDKRNLTKENNPIIVTVGGKNDDKDYEKLKEINRLPGGNNVEILRNVHSKLLTIDAYLNERGNIFDKVVYRNLGKFDKVTSTTSLDILIFGGSRSGKSTFINLLSDSLLAREQVNLAPCTTKCTEYIIPFNDKNEQDGNINENLENQVLEQINHFRGNLKIIDTPGFIEEHDVSKVQQYIEEEIEIIQLALFFMTAQDPTINKSKKLLKLLLKYDIPIFFIETHCVENKDIENSIFYQCIINFIANNFSREEADKILIHNEQNKIYNIIRINQKKRSRTSKYFWC